MEELYGGYLGGDDPVFRGDTVNIGADEYWDTNNREVFREYVTFLDGLMQQYGKTTRMWGIAEEVRRNHTDLTGKYCD